MGDDAFGNARVLNEAVSIYFADATLASAFVARWCVQGRDGRRRLPPPKRPSRSETRFTFAHQIAAGSAPPADALGLLRGPVGTYPSDKPQPIWKGKGFNMHPPARHGKERRAGAGAPVRPNTGLGRERRFQFRQKPFTQHLGPLVKPGFFGGAVTAIFARVSASMDRNATASGTKGLSK